MTRVIFSFGGGMTSFWGAIHAIEEYGAENVDVVNAALLDDEPHVRPVIDAFEQHTAKPITRITVAHPGFSFAQKLRLEAEAGRMSPPMFKWLLDSYKTRGRNTTAIVEVHEPLHSVWDVFYWRGILGSSQRDPCSDRLKREVLRRYIRDTYPQGSIVAVGMTKDETDREMRTRKVWKERGYQLVSPLMGTDYQPERAIEDFQALFGFVPESYLLGMDHNNCGACVKGGQEHFARVLYYRPEVYQMWAFHEQYHQAVFQHDNTILRRMRDGKYERLPLDTLAAEMRERWKESHVLPGMEDLLFFGLEKTPGCRYCDSAA